eukprot:scaffold2133_cov259-Pinguiococcus_pyrenoidosus.AAC.5
MLSAGDTEKVRLEAASRCKSSRLGERSDLIAVPLHFLQVRSSEPFAGRKGPLRHLHHSVLQGAENQVLEHAERTALAHPPKQAHVSVFRAQGKRLAVRQELPQKRFESLRLKPPAVAAPCSKG